jgi:hypothetical protein
MQSPIHQCRATSSDESTIMLIYPALRSTLPLALLASAAVTTAHAQWTVTSLHPAGPWAWSEAFAIHEGQQVGRVSPNAWPSVGQRASLWNGTAASWVDLTPAGASLYNWANGTYGGQQVGRVHTAGVWRASLWSGTPGSRIDLTPPGSPESYCIGIGGGQQVGGAQNFGACLWTGTAASCVALHPAGAISSEAVGTDGEQQVGWVSYTGGNWTSGHASLWTGSAASWVNLNPPGATHSMALAVHNGEQVGYAGLTGGASRRACLWRGSVESLVDLHPPGASISEARGVFDGWQVGQATINGAPRAALWRGTAESHEDLSLALPPSYGSFSIARGVWHDGHSIYIAGSAWNTVLDRNEAILWTRPLFSPCYPNCDGSTAAPILNIDDFTCFINNFAAATALPHAQQLEHYSNCDNSTIAPILNVDDFTCFINAFAAGCR